FRTSHCAARCASRRLPSGRATSWRARARRALHLTERSSWLRAAPCESVAVAYDEPAAVKIDELGAPQLSEQQRHGRARGADDEREVAVGEPAIDDLAALVLLTPPGDGVEQKTYEARLPPLEQERLQARFHCAAPLEEQRHDGAAQRDIRREKPPHRR